MIIVDTREPKEITNYLTKKNINYQVQKLIIGDYIVNDILVERKTWTDFFESYRTGRLYKQMLQLYQHKNSILILEGFHLEHVGNKEAFYSLITKILFQYNIKITFSHDIGHTAAFLIALSWNTRQKKQEKINKQDEYPVFFPVRLLPSQLSVEQRKRHILSCFPMIGPKKAERILTNCLSLRNLFTAPEKQLAEYGIGIKGQKKFQEILDK